jgi:hypothetical protein
LKRECEKKQNSFSHIVINFPIRIRFAGSAGSTIRQKFV